MRSAMPRSFSLYSQGFDPRLLNFDNSSLLCYYAWDTDRTQYSLFDVTKSLQSTSWKYRKSIAHHLSRLRSHC